MALYIKPPSGHISFNKLCTFVLKRLVFLYYIYGHSVDEISKIIERDILAENSECLIEGTVKDNVSHFVLRFLCASDSLMENFLVQSEVKLFNYRLQFYDFLQLRLLLQKASKHSQYILFHRCYASKPYANVLKSIVIAAKEVEQAVERREKVIKVPFTSALKFVQERLYPLHCGYLIIPLNDLKLYLLNLCEDTVIQGIYQMKTSLCLKELQDPKMQYMHWKLKKWLYSKFSNPVITSNNRFISKNALIDESSKFPLCMLNLHNLLYKHHRLKHMSRIQYILFLKEIGVPCSGVKDLFMKEYSVPVSETRNGNHAQCSHSWTDSGKRYIYSIEHLYGMRGACKNYKAHSCHSLQNVYDSDGGCPFVTYDTEHLQKTLQSLSFEVEDIEDIISQTEKKEYQNACHCYLGKQVSKHQTKEKNSLVYSAITENKKSKHIGDSISEPFINSNALLFESYRNTNVLTSPQLQISCPSEFYFILSKLIDM